MPASDSGFFFNSGCKKLVTKGVHILYIIYICDLAYRLFRKVTEVWVSVGGSRVKKGGAESCIAFVCVAVPSCCAFSAGFLRATLVRVFPGPEIFKQVVEERPPFLNQSNTIEPFRTAVFFSLFLHRSDGCGLVIRHCYVFSSLAFGLSEVNPSPQAIRCSVIAIAHQLHSTTCPTALQSTPAPPAERHYRATPHVLSVCDSFP